MKRLQLSETVSNMLLFSSVVMAALPFLLGDQLFLLVTSFMREAPIMMNQFYNYFIRLLS